MCAFRFTIPKSYRQELERQLKNAQRLGTLRRVKYLLAILAVMHGQQIEDVALTLQLCPKTVSEWVRLAGLLWAQRPQAPEADGPPRETDQGAKTPTRRLD
jgi:hypothetical protein